MIPGRHWEPEHDDDTGSRLEGSKKPQTQMSSLDKFPSAKVSRALGGGGTKHLLDTPYDHITMCTYLGILLINSGLSVAFLGVAHSLGDTDVG